MGRPADENLPEVVTNPNHPNSFPPALDPSPEVLSPGDAVSHENFSIDREKYPVHLDHAPKLLYDPNDEQGNGQQWPIAVSALSPDGGPWERLPAGEESTANLGNGVRDKQKQICGMRRRSFIILIVALAVIIAAAVGGGVGGARARSGSSSGTSSRGDTEDSNSQSPSTSTSPTSTSSPSEASTTSTTSSSLPTPTVEFLNNQTGLMGLAFQGFGEANYLGKPTDIIRTEGFYDFDHDLKSYVWLPNNTDCCVTFCADKETSVGWRCQMRYRAKTEDGTGFPRINIWCTGRTQTDKYSQMCS